MSSTPRRASATRRFAAAAVLATGLTGGMVAMSPSAEALPNTCSVYNNGDWGSAHCKGGTGQFRVVVNCHDAISGRWYRTFGPWANVHYYSKSACGGYGRADYVGYERRG